MTNERIDKASRFIHASPPEVYAAFATQRALQMWLPPNDMEGQVSAFDFQEGGGYQMRLTYTRAEHTVGKTTEHSDETVLRFIRLIPNERIEQAVTFNSEQKEFSGEMKMTWTFEERESDTLVTVACTNVPDGIRPEDHEVGLTSSLKNLAEFVEKQS
jgi:uncharacterized protein YndB with AHSA1/START domain